MPAVVAFALAGALTVLLALGTGRVLATSGAQVAAVLRTVGGGVRRWSGAAALAVAAWLIVSAVMG